MLLRSDTFFAFIDKISQFTECTIKSKEAHALHVMYRIVFCGDVFALTVPYIIFNIKCPICGPLMVVDLFMI